MITRFIENALKGKPPTIYGDGQQTRDFIHVVDVAEAIRLAVEKQPLGKTINIATGKPTKIAQLARTIAGLVGQDLKPKHTKPRPGDIKHSDADIRKAKDALGYEPRISLKEGLSALIK